MAIVLRAGRKEDADACALICFNAFKTISEKHGFPPDIPTIEVARKFIPMLLGHPGFYSVVAEENGRVVGSNFMSEYAVIGGIGPLTVDPSAQNGSIGRQLMNAVLVRAEEKKLAGVRLVQAAFHSRSLSLYTKLGFDVREPLVVLQGRVLKLSVPGYTVRAARINDADDCNRVCAAVHGHSRPGELADAIAQGEALLVEHDGRVTGYATGIGFFNHAVGETNEDLKALIGAAQSYSGPGFLLPARDGRMFRWCLDHGLRVVEVLTLMSKGLYNEPSGASLPSITF